MIRSMLQFLKLVKACWTRIKMALQPNNLNYTSALVIDKVVYDDTVTAPLSYTVAGGGTTTTQTVTNPYGKVCFITLSWSVDGTNYYPAQAYTTSNALYTANGWVDATSVYIYMENYAVGSVTFSIKYALDTIT